MCWTSRVYARRCCVDAKVWGMIARDGVHNASLRILNLLWGRPEEQAWWRQWEGLMSLRCCVVTSGSASPCSCFPLLDHADGGNLDAAWRWPSAEMASVRKWSSA